MHRPVEHYTSDRLPNKHPFPPDRPEDENSDVDYNVMCDLYYLKRNKEGDAFFDDIEPDTCFVTPRGHVVKRIGPKGFNPAYPELKSLKRTGFPIVSGYWQAKIGAWRSVMIHHLVYAAFGDMSCWDGKRLDHTPDNTRSNNYIHNLKPASAQSDATSKQVRLHTPLTQGGQLYRNNTSGVTGLCWDQSRPKPGWCIKFWKDKQVVFSKWMNGDEYPNNEEGRRAARQVCLAVRKTYLGIDHSLHQEKTCEKFIPYLV